MTPQSILHRVLSHPTRARHIKIRTLLLSRGSPPLTSSTSPPVTSHHFLLRKQPSRPPITHSPVILGSMAPWLPASGAPFRTGTWQGKHTHVVTFYSRARFFASAVAFGVLFSDDGPSAWLGEERQQAQKKKKQESRALVGSALVRLSDTAAPSLAVGKSLARPDCRSWMFQLLPVIHSIHHLVSRRCHQQRN